MKKQISQCHTVTEVLGLESEITNHRFLPICPPRDHATVDPWEFGKPFGSFKVLHVHVGLVILTIHVSRRAAITTFLQRTRTYKSALCLLSSPLFRHYFEHFAFCLGSPAPQAGNEPYPSLPLTVHPHSIMLMDEKTPRSENAPYSCCLRQHHRDHAFPPDVSHPFACTHQDSTHKWYG